MSALPLFVGVSALGLAAASTWHRDYFGALLALVVAVQMLGIALRRLGDPKGEWASSAVKGVR